MGGAAECVASIPPARTVDLKFTGVARTRFTPNWNSSGTIPVSGILTEKYGPHYHGIRRFSEDRRKIKPKLKNNSASYFLLNNDIGLIEFHSKANTLDNNSMELVKEDRKSVV